MGISDMHVIPMIITCMLQGTLCNTGIPCTFYGGNICSVVLKYSKGFFKNANGLIAPFQLWDLQKPLAYTLVMRCPQVIFVSLRFTLVQNCINWDVCTIMISGFFFCNNYQKNKLPYTREQKHVSVSDTPCY